MGNESTSPWGDDTTTEAADNPWPAPESAGSTEQAADEAADTAAEPAVEDAEPDAKPAPKKRAARKPAAPAPASDAVATTDGREAITTVIASTVRTLSADQAIEELSALRDLITDAVDLIERSRSSLLEQISSL